MNIYISATLRSFFGGNDSLETDAGNIADAIKFLTDEYPDSKSVLLDDDGNIRSFIRLYLNDTDVTDPKKWDEATDDDAELLLLPAIAGGRPEPLITDDRRKAVTLDDTEVERFGKHLLLKEIGVKGQKRIKAARVVVAGAGALGSPVIEYLAASGVGTIKAVDFDNVTLENTQSQILHTARDVKRPKVASARDKVRNINKGINFEDENSHIDKDNIISIIDGYDLVIDCTDNYKTRYLINDACVLCGIPEVYGAIYQYEGMLTVLNYGNGGCLRCIFPAPPPKGMVPTCATGGAISPLPGVIGSLMANEALKLIMGIGEHLDGRLLSIDSMNLRWRFLETKKDKNCQICSANPLIRELTEFDYDDFCGLKEDESELPVEGYEPEELARKIESGESITIVDVREPHERAIQRFPGAIVIPIGQLARRKGELNPEQETIFICRQGQRSILAINTLREAGYMGPMYNLKGGIDAMKDIMFSNEGAWL